MKFTQAFKMAITSVLANRMRSFLTMLGIIIGITSVIVLVAIGQGTAKSVTDAISSMGTNLITVNITSSSSSLTSDDISQLKEDSAIKYVAPDITSSVTVKAGSNNANTTVEGTEPSYEDVRDIHAAYGRFITQDDINNRYRVAVVGIDVLANLFPDVENANYESLLGKKISVNGTWVEIVGILQSKGTSMTGSSDDRMIMPLSTAERLLKDTDVKTYYIGASSSDTVTEATNVLESYLLQKFDNDTTDFKVLSQSEMISTRNQTANTMTLMLAGIAAISLLVGGIGIMNIMLVSVVERTREIGIRKAIGAKRRDILSQFIIEAIFLSCLGGIIGVLLGIIICIVLPLLTSLTVVMQVPVMLLAFGFSAGVGIVFGFYPANKASKLRPIEALRYE